MSRMNPEKRLYNTALSDQLPGLVGHSLLTMYVCIFIQILCPIKRVKTNDIWRKKLAGAVEI